MNLSDTLSPPIRRQLRGKVDEATERLALRGVLTAASIFGLAAGTHLRQLRSLNDPDGWRSLDSSQQVT